jgi:branched-chain amino acid transport system ATP-binding protein
VIRDRLAHRRGPEHPLPVIEAAPVLQLDDVYAGYNQFRALFGVSFTVGRGKAVALIGPNGVGKTTVARVASGLVVPTAGRVLVSGMDVTGAEAHVFARAGIAHAPEGRSIFGSLSVEENLVLPFRRQYGRTGQAHALEQAYHLFPRLGERRSQEAGSLSGGEQRMLTLARVLVLEPKLLIADELSLGLAPIVTHEVYDVLRRILANGTALLVIEQQVDHALSLADHVVVLERGCVVRSGSPDEIDATSESFR